MSENWEFAVSQATGDYVTVVGDDDGLMPYALRELDRLIAKHDRPEAIHWHRGIYTWPTIRVPEDADYLHLPMCRSLDIKDGREQLLRASRYEIGADMLPMIYSAAIRRDILDDIRRSSGRLFPNLYPDIYSAYAIAYNVKAYVSVGVPMGIAGLSGNSNGVATLMMEDGGRASEEFFRLHREAGFTHHPSVPNLTLMPIHSDDSFQHAKDRFFPQDADLVLDRRRMVERYLAAITDREPSARTRIRSVIRSSLAERPDLLDWFDGLPDPEPAAPFRIKPSNFGFNGAAMTLDTKAHGVQDIQGAVQLCSALLGFGPDGIVYDGGAPHLPAAAPALRREAVLYGELHAATTERTALRAQLAAAEADRAALGAQLAAAEAERARLSSLVVSPETEPASCRNGSDAVPAAIPDQKIPPVAMATPSEPSSPASARASSPVRSLARFGYRLIRPFVRPALHRLRAFMIAPQLAEIERLRGELQELRAAAGQGRGRAAAAPEGGP